MNQLIVTESSAGSGAGVCMELREKRIVGWRDFASDSYFFALSISSSLSSLFFCKVYIQLNEKNPKKLPHTFSQEFFL